MSSSAAHANGGPSTAFGSHGSLHVNAATGLATDYLNHFNEAIMLLEMIASCPEYVDDFLAWRPMSYREHFALSAFTDREATIAAYDNADPAVRNQLDRLATTMNAVLDVARHALGAGLPAANIPKLSQEVSVTLRPLITRASAIINGDAGTVSEGALAQIMADVRQRRS